MRVCWLQRKKRLHVQHGDRGASCLQRIMIEEGIELDKRYPAASVAGAFEFRLRHKVALHCRHHRVTEVWVCLSNKLKMMDCPENVRERGECKTAEFPYAAPPGHDRHGSVAEARA